MAVTKQAVGILPASPGTHAPNHVLMTADTFVLNYIFIKSLDPQRFREITGSKGSAVIPSVDGFYRIFTKKIVRGMAVITGSCSMMARAGPGIKMLSHDVAVFAGNRVILQIGSTLRVVKGISGQAEYGTQT